MARTPVTEAVLTAARMVVTEGLGEGRPAHGFFIIVADGTEILANERNGGPDITLCRYGHIYTFLDRRAHNLMIGDCMDPNNRRRNFLNLFHEDGAIIVDRQSGQVLCGGFIVRNLGVGFRRGLGTRVSAAAAIVAQVRNCYVVLASHLICGSFVSPPGETAKFHVFNGTLEPEEVAVYEGNFRRSVEQWLHPLDFTADLTFYDTYFVAQTREWILNQIEQWRAAPQGPSCKVLLACPGFGKSTIAARFYRQMSDRVLAIHLFRANHSHENEPRRMIESIACQIAMKLPQFREALLEVRGKVDDATDAYSLLSTARQLADSLLFNPLHRMGTPSNFGENGRYVIIIDALDEAEQDARSDLLDLVAFDFRDKLPHWLAVLVTASSDVDTYQRLEPLGPTVLDSDRYRPDCVADVDAYLEEILRPIVGDQVSRDRAKNVIAEKSGLLFLYLHLIRLELEVSADIDSIPSSLGAVYQQNLERALGSEVGLGDENSPTRRFVEAIVAAPVPVSATGELPRLSGLPREEIHKCVRRLPHLEFFTSGDRQCVKFHVLFVDWLTRERGPDDRPEFIVDRRAAHHRLASACAVPLIRLLN